MAEIFPHHIVVACEIHDNEEPIKELFDLILDTEAKAPLTIFLTSEGGHVDVALALGGAISNYQRRGGFLTIHVGGVAHSAATLLVQFANKRVIQPHTTFRIHEISSNYEGTMSRTEMIGETKIFDNYDANYFDILAMRTGIKVDKWKELLAAEENDWLLDAKAILQYKLADEVISYPPAFYHENDLDSSGIIVPSRQDKPRTRRSRKKDTVATET